MMQESMPNQDRPGLQPVHPGSCPAAGHFAGTVAILGSQPDLTLVLAVLSGYMFGAAMADRRPGSRIPA